MLHPRIALAAFLSLIFVTAAHAANYSCSGWTCGLLADATGTVRYSPSLGVLDDAEVRMFSTCDVPASGGVEYRRGYVEFDLSDVTYEIASATLTLRETLEVGEYPAPVALHEVSFYPGDLVVDAGDLETPAVPLATFQTDDGNPGQFFDIDVTDAVRSLKGSSIGFRVKLTVDPAGPCDPQGAMFDGITEADPPLLTITAVEPLAVPVDIRPTECPNRLDRRDNKLLVAINGYEGLDVRLIDPSSVRIRGVAAPPLRSQIKDVSTPYFPLRGKEGPLACLSEGRDGVPDLLLVFDAQAIIQAIAIDREAARPWSFFSCQPNGQGESDCRLSVGGRTKPEAGGEPFSGEDIVIVGTSRPQAAQRTRPCAVQKPMHPP